MIKVKCIYKEGKKRKQGIPSESTSKGYLLENKKNIRIKSHYGSNDALHIHYKMNDEISKEQSIIDIYYEEHKSSDKVLDKVHILVGDYILEYTLTYFLWRAYPSNKQEGTVISEYSIHKIYKHNNLIDDIVVWLFAECIPDDLDIEKINNIIIQCEEVL